MLKNSSLFVLLGVGLLLIAGCGDSGPSLSPVSGKVTRGGKPLEKVLVTFYPVSGGVGSSGMTGSGGSFILISQSGRPGAVAGKHKVTISLPDSGGHTGGTGATDWAKMAKDRDARIGAGKDGAPAAEVKSEEKVPSEYADVSKTPLEFTVAAGSNTFEIPLPE
jgi:hypothetical protein